MMLSDSISTHPTIIKAAVQCFVLQALMNMIKLVSSGPYIINLLAFSILSIA